MLYGDALAFCGDDNGYSCSDGDSYDDNACNVHARDNNHAHDALAASAGGVLCDGEVTGALAAD
jgi:hypothetical protein